MTKSNDLSQRDLRRLEKIEQILVDGNDIEMEENSIYGFCSHLASTVPMAEPDYRERVVEQMEAIWYQQLTAQVDPSPQASNLRNWFAPFLHALGRMFHISGRSTPLRRQLVTRRSIVLVVLLTLIVGSLTVAFVPSVRAALFHAIQEYVLGPNTVVFQVDPITEPDSPPMIRSDMWIIRTEIGNFGGNAPPWVEPIVRSVDSYEDAQTLTDFHLMEPTFLPDGYIFYEAKLAPIGLTSWVILFYSGPGHDIIIAQMPGGPQPSEDPNVAMAVKTGIMTDGTIETVDFYGRLALWIEGQSLIWEVDGVSYQLGSLDLDIDQAMEIARSLR